MTIRQSPHIFNMRGRISSDNVLTGVTCAWSIEFQIDSVGSAGFYVINDSLDIPQANPSHVYGSSNPVVSGVDILRTTYNELITGTTDDPGHTFFTVDRNLLFAPEITTAVRQDYWLTYTLHCDDYFGLTFAHLGISLYSLDQTDNPGQPNDGNWNNISHLLDAWWQSGAYFGVNHANDYSYDAETHTVKIVKKHNVPLMIIEQN